MKSDLQRFRELAAANSDLPERVIRLVAEQVISPADVVIDAGAFMGLHTKSFLARCRSGRVVSYEAQPSYADRLRDQFDRYDHVEIRNRALVGDPDQQEVTFFIDQQFPSRSTLNPDGEPGGARADRDHQVTSITVSATTLDKDLASLGVSRREISFVKIDVEGAEFAVLQGAQQVLAEGRPIIVLEHGADAPRVGGYELCVFDDFIRDRNYQLVAFDGSKLDAFDTAFWYFWLVPDELVAARLSVFAAALQQVLAEQESDTSSARVRRRAQEALVVTKRTIAHRLPEPIKRRLRRLLPRF